MKRVAIYSGGDWTDANCEHLIVPENTDLDLEYENYRNWIEKEYWPKFNTSDKIPCMTFEGWLIKKCNASKDHDIEEFWE